MTVNNKTDLCMHNSILIDEKRAEAICQDCGEVIEDHIINPKLNPFDDSEFHYITGEKDHKGRYIRKPKYFRLNHPPPKLGYKRVLDYLIHTICANLELPDIVCYDAISFKDAYRENNNNKNRMQSRMLLRCAVFHACRLHEIPMTIDRIMHGIEYPSIKFKFGHYYYKFVKGAAPPQVGTSPVPTLKRICNMYNCWEHYGKCLEIIEEYKENNATGRKGSILAVFAITRILKDPPMYKIAEKIGVSASQIYSMAREVY